MTETTEKKSTSRGKDLIHKIVTVAMLSALSYVCFTFIQFQIPLGGGDSTSLHLGNLVPVLGALLFGGVYGGLGGAIGMGIGDLFYPQYVIYVPRTVILKFCIGVITGLVAHKVFKIKTIPAGKKRTVATVVSSLCGLAFNAIVEPIIKYFYSIVILGQAAAEVTISWNIAACVINGIVSLIAATILYLALRPKMEKAKLLK